jgi:Galactose binding lectin domain
MEPGTKQAGIAVTGLFLLILCCLCLSYFVSQVQSSMSQISTPPSPPTGGSPASRQCAQSPAAVFPSPSPSSFTITAPTGSTISSIDYANFGNATGLCGAYTDGSCSLYPDSSVMTLIRSACLNNSTCTVPLSTQTFGILGTNVDQTCSNPTYLTVQYSTSSPAPAPAPSPSSS